MKHYGFPKAYKLRSKKEIETLFAQGNTYFAPPLKIVWQIHHECNETSPIKIAISVSKKRFKHAVTRNLIKRRIRESARMCFPDIKHRLREQNSSFTCIIIYIDKHVLSYKTIVTSISQAFYQIIPTRETM